MKKVYKINTAQGTVDLVEADSVELDPSLNRITFSLEGQPVASFAGYMSFSVHNPELHAEMQARAAEAAERRTD